jgi:CheY-specific phosphatase CheX
LTNSRLGVDLIVPILCQATQETLEQCTGREIEFSPTIQKIPKISIRPDLGGFVEIFGDYNGLVIMNFSDAGALAIYRYYMLSMGIPENELATHASSTEVADSIGELINQIMGRCQQLVEVTYNLNAHSGQPKALTLNRAISLTPELSIGSADSATVIDNRRISFQMEQLHFHMEIAMERTEFISL